MKALRTRQISGLERFPLWWTLMVLAATIMMYLRLFRFPFTPIQRAGDQWIFLMYADRMWEGESIYRDFFSNETPGTELVHLLFFSVFGPRNWIPHVELILLGIGMAALMVVLARRICSGVDAFLAAALFLVVVFQFVLDTTHHWFSTIAALGAIVSLKYTTHRRLAVAGSLCGVASAFTQTQGLMAALGIAGFVWWEGRRRGMTVRDVVTSVGVVGGCFAGVFLATQAYFIGRAGIERYWYCIVVFVLFHLRGDTTWNGPGVYFRNLPPFTLGDSLRYVAFIFLHALLPLGYLLPFAHWTRAASRLDESQRSQLVLLTFVGGLMLVGVAASPAYFRLASVSPMVFVVFVCCVTRYGIPKVARTLAWTVVALMAVRYSIEPQLAPASFLSLPRGQMAFLDPAEYQLFRGVRDRTNPGDTILSASREDLVFPLALRNATEVPYLENSAYTRPEQVAGVVTVLDQARVKFILWPPYSMRVYRPDADHLGPLRAYISAHYETVADLPDSQLLRRRDQR